MAGAVAYSTAHQRKKGAGSLGNSSPLQRSIIAGESSCETRLGEWSPTLPDFVSRSRFPHLADPESQERIRCAGFSELVAAAGHRSGAARSSRSTAARGGGSTAAHRSTAAVLALLPLAHPARQAELLVLLAAAAVARIAAGRSGGSAAGRSSRSTAGRSGGRSAAARGRGGSTAARSGGSASGRGRSAAARGGGSAAGRLRSAAARGRSAAVELLREQAGVGVVQAGETHQSGGNPSELHFQIS